LAEIDLRYSGYRARSIADRRRLARELRERGEAALTLLAEGLGDYAPKM
jgi:hypothetical protein